jgi:hypothetical protein
VIYNYRAGARMVANRGRRQAPSQRRALRNHRGVHVIKNHTLFVPF